MSGMIMKRASDWLKCAWNNRNGCIYEKGGIFLKRSLGYSSGKWNRTAERQGFGQSKFGRTDDMDDPREFVYGGEAVMSILSGSLHRSTCYALYLLDSNGGNDKGNGVSTRDAAYKRAEELGIRTRMKSRDELNRISGNRPHNGIVLETDPIDVKVIDSLDAQHSVPSRFSSPLWLALDEVVDPQV